jgi:hypothetical protein
MKTKTQEKKVAKKKATGKKKPAGPTKPKNKGGRPKTRTDEEIKKIKNDICERIATTSRSLRQICRDMVKDYDKMPSFSAVKYMLVDDTEFQAQYAQAKLRQADLLFDEIIEISDDDSLDLGFTEEGKAFVNHEHINRSRLRVDSRKFYIAKILPKKYSEKHVVTGEDGGPIQIDVSKKEMSDTELAARVAFLLQQGLK